MASCPSDYFCRVCGTKEDKAKSGNICKSCDAARVKAYYRKTREDRVKSKDRYNKANREKVNRSKRASYRKYRASYRRREEARRRGYVIEITVSEWRAIKKAFGNKCLKCGTKKDITKDHVIPIKLGGRDHASNVQPLCRSCNSSKGTKIVDYRPKP